MDLRKEIYPRHPVLLVDDEVHTLASFDIALRSHGITNTIRCQDSREVATILRRQAIEIVLLDLMMPHVSGQEILRDIREHFSEIPVIVITGVNEVDTAVQCIKSGAFDYVLKPVDIERLLPSIHRGFELRNLRRENSRLTDVLFAEGPAHPEVFAGVITNDRRMNALFRYCEAIAEGQQAVLITGATGVGKESIARAIHELSGRSGEYVAVNVAGLDDQIFADTLFGHSRGAFTGADRPRAGLVEKASNGTLFLDEIGDLSEASQVKLLRFLEEREYYPLGTDTAKRSNTRVIVATHRDLREAQRTAQFRSDLYYRLRTHVLHIPPLRERADDIPALLDFFLEQAAKEFHKKKPSYPAELIGLLKAYSFPGNIRELRAMVFDALSNHRGRILSMDFFKKNILPDRKATPAAGLSQSLEANWLEKIHPLPTLKNADHLLIQEALRRTNNNQRLAAGLLGISPQALSQRLKRSS